MSGPLSTMPAGRVGLPQGCLGEPGSTRVATIPAPAFRTPHGPPRSPTHRSPRSGSAAKDGSRAWRQHLARRAVRCPCRQRVQDGRRAGRRGGALSRCASPAPTSCGCTTRRKRAPRVPAEDVPTDDEWPREADGHSPAVLPWPDGCPAGIPMRRHALTYSRMRPRRRPRPPRTDVSDSQCESESAERKQDVKRERDS